MFNVGAGEIAVILVVALLILGPNRLPEMARGIGKFMRDFRRQTDEVRTTLETEFYRMDRDLLSEDPKKALPIPPAYTPKDVADATELPIAGPLDGGRRPVNELATPNAPPPFEPAAPDAAAPPPAPQAEGVAPEADEGEPR
jgi:sec-independent protein translocase protein TatB